MKNLLMSLLCVLSLGAGVAHGEGGTTTRLTVDGLVYAVCAQGIDSSLRRLVAVATRNGTDIDDAALTDTPKDAGYTVRAIERVELSLDAVRSGSS